MSDTVTYKEGQVKSAILKVVQELPEETGGIYLLISRDLPDREGFANYTQYSIYTSEYKEVLEKQCQYAFEKKFQSPGERLLSSNGWFGLGLFAGIALLWTALHFGFKLPLFGATP